MTREKPVGRSRPMTVIHRKDPRPTGTRKESDATMAIHTQAHREPRPLGRLPRLARPCSTCAVLLATVALVLLGGGVADAGEWVQVSCINPNQTEAGSAGWLSVIAGGGYGSNTDSNCGPGSSMLGILSTDAPVSVGSAETLRYIPPAGSTLNGGQLDVGMYADGKGAGAFGTAVADTPEYADNVTNIFFQCASGLTPCANGTNDFTGELAIPAGRGGNLYLSAGCGGSAGASCNEGGSNGAWSLVELWWANLRLSNSSTPAASGVSGTLINSEARGIKELTFTATDPAGPGVYNVTVQADGQTLYSGTPDSNGGACVPAGSSGTSLMFDASQPCKQSEAVDLPIDTTAVRDGQHTLKVTVKDAAQNTSVVYDATITTHNAPASGTPPSIVTSGQPLPGGPLSVARGEWSAPTGAGALTYSYQWQLCDAQGNNCEAIPGAEGSGYTPTASDVGHTLRAVVSATDSDGSTAAASAASSIVAPAPPTPGLAASSATDAFTASAIAGVPNGAGASEAAQLHIAGRAAISRSFAHRAFTISGQVLNGAGAPIGDATLDVREQSQGSSAPQTIGHAKTATNGSFTVQVPAGASRLILLAYRAYSNDPANTTQAAVQETVTAGVQMHITPRRTSPAGSITLAGHVDGPVPHRGVVVELLVHYRGHWEPLRTPRTDPSGRFSVPYQFQGAIGRFPFRAEVFGGQSGFPYTTGRSRPVDVTTN
jgi:hypothetical protein